MRTTPSPLSLPCTLHTPRSRARAHIHKEIRGQASHNMPPLLHHYHTYTHTSLTPPPLCIVTLQRTDHNSQSTPPLFPIPLCIHEHTPPSFHTHTYTPPLATGVTMETSPSHPRVASHNSNEHSHWHPTISITPKREKKGKGVTWQLCVPHDLLLNLSVHVCMYAHALYCIWASAQVVGAAGGEAGIKQQKNKK